MPEVTKLMKNRSSLIKNIFVVVVLAGGVGALVNLLISYREFDRPGIKYYAKGMQDMNSHHILLALSDWRQGIKQDPSSWQCYEQMGLFYQKTLHYSTSTKYLLKATKLHPNDVGLQLELVTSAQKAGRVDIAESAAKKAASLAPKNIKVLKAYALIEQEMHNRGEAILLMHRALKLAPTDSSILLALVNEEMNNMQMSAAQNDLMPYLKSHPTDGEACYMMAVIYNQKAQTPENVNTAMRYAIRAGKASPNDIRPYILVGQILVNTNHYRKALKVFQSGFHIDPQSSGILNGLRICYAHLKDTSDQQKVAKYFDKVLSWQNEASELKLRLGSNPGDWKLGLKLADTEDKLGKFSKAILYYKLMIIQNPKNQVARKAFSAFYLEHGQKRLAKLALQPGYVPLIDPSQE